MKNFEEIHWKFENISWNCKVLRGISKEILKKYTRKQFWRNIKDFRNNIIKVIETF